jgi:hypothetical protein
VRRLLRTVCAHGARVGVETSPVNVRDAREIERSVEAFARLPNGGLVVTQTANFYRDTLLARADEVIE